jgi:hypothetical protein
MIHVEGTVEVRNAYRILVRRGKRTLVRLGVNDRIILK